MTDFKNHDKKTQKSSSFKEKILADLEEANRERKRQEEALRQKEMEIQRAAMELQRQEEEQARLKAELEAQLKAEEKERLAAEQRRQEAETARLEAEAQARLEEELAEQARIKGEEEKRQRQERQRQEAEAERLRHLEEARLQAEKLESERQAEAQARLEEELAEQARIEVEKEEEARQASETEKIEAEHQGQEASLFQTDSESEVTLSHSQVESLGIENNVELSESSVTSSFNEEPSQSLEVSEFVQETENIQDSSPVTSEVQAALENQAEHDVELLEQELQKQEQERRLKEARLAEAMRLLALKEALDKEKEEQFSDSIDGNRLEALDSQETDDQTLSFGNADIESEEPISEKIEETPEEDSPSDLESSNLLEESDPEEEEVVAPITLQDLSDEEILALRQKRKRTLATRIASILVVIIILVGLITTFFGYRYVNKALGAKDAKSSEYVTVEVPIGSGNKLIGRVLQEAGLITDANVFNYYTKFKNVADLQSGYYNLQASMTVDEIIQELQKGGTAEPEKPIVGKILITEGYTIKQIAKAITTDVNNKNKDKTPFKEEDFLTLIQDETFISKMVKKYPKLLANLPDKDKATYRLEGYLFPATYNYYEDSSLEDVVDEMLKTMDSYLTSYYDQIAASDYNVNEILTLASLVEKEGSTDDDRRQIAGVFYNRIKENMPLQSNIAILYAQGKLGEKTTLAEDAGIDTAIDSPYNIYKNTGLMPGPVDSPSLSAIEATLNPTNSDNLFFVADVTTGKVYYAKDLETHDSNVEKYVNSQIASTTE